MSKIDKILSRFHKTAKELDDLVATNADEIGAHEENISYASKRKEELHAENAKAAAVADKIRALVA